MDNLNLLLVEDDIPSLEMMTEVFASLNAAVRPVSDSEQAVQIGQQGAIRRNFS
jgi:CheY-like chemotaxis protein